MAPTASIYIDDAAAAPFFELINSLSQQAQRGEGGEEKEGCQRGEGKEGCQKGEGKEGCEKGDGGEGAGRRGGPCGGGSRGGAWGWGGPWAHGAPWAQGGRGPWGGPGGPWAARREEWRRCHEGQDFSPAADVFDTKEAYVIHVSLPGANKEDIGINYDYDESELQISGVVHKPGNEEFLKTISRSERKSGAFERKIKLGDSDSKNPASVEADGITAKLENGILEVTIPKKEKEPEQEKRKIEIE